MFQTSLSRKLDGEEIKDSVADVDHLYACIWFVVNDIGIDLLGEVVGQIGTLLTHKHKPADQSMQTYVMLAETFHLEKWL